jgi:hypothetical protein
LDHLNALQDALAAASSQDVLALRFEITIAENELVRRGLPPHALELLDGSPTEPLEASAAIGEPRRLSEHVFGWADSGAGADMVPTRARSPSVIGPHNTLKRLAGAPGFEPGNAGIKILHLIATAADIDRRLSPKTARLLDFLRPNPTYTVTDTIFGDTPVIPRAPARREGRYAGKDHQTCG